MTNHYYLLFGHFNEGCLYVFSLDVEVGQLVLLFDYSNAEFYS